MRIKCEYCDNFIEETALRCPYCGATNVNVKRGGEDVPQTIEELKAFAEEKGLPLEKMRFFIGEDYKKPRAFGIYREDDGHVVVYKNKANGERVYRYRGTDEAYGVNEIYQKMRSEIQLRKKKEEEKEANKQSPRESFFETAKIMGLVFAIILAWCVAFGGIFHLVKALDNDGYYNYNEQYYYKSDRDWYVYDDEGWKPTKADKELSRHKGAYYEGKSYDQESGVENFKDSEYYSVTSESDWNDDWDDDDWDVGSSWDSNDTDWDSDW